jgi:Family of unknown function (DUF6286)
MIRHPRRGIPATVVALVILAGCVLVAVSCIQQLVGHPPVVSWARLAGYGQRLHWHDATVLTAGGIAAGLGVVLLACAVLPGTPTVLPLAADHDTNGPVAAGNDRAAVDAGLTRRSLQHALRQAAADADGVTGASVRANYRTVVSTVRSPRRDRAEVSDLVGRQLQRRLDLAALARRPRLRVHVRTKRAP